MIDLEKRRKIMQRSIKLGHCICNPKQGCPCDTFKLKDICPCAGERPENALESVELTKMVEKAGCASKINQNDLKLALAGLPEMTDPNLLVGTNTCDDAGVYKLDDDTALVQTVDVFMPSVDDPYTFGQIAAANSLSDIYAMGGKPLTALTIIGFPIETVSPRVMTQMLRGGMDKMREAGCVIAGGHSINDKDPKFGYAVTGVIHPSKIVKNSGAKPGDALVLTKPLGAGAISFASQCGEASDAAVAAASKSMTQLNKTAAEVMLEIGVNAATDVTGFGLAGHLSEMVAQSLVGAEVFVDCVPVFDEVMDYINRGMISGGCERNKEYAEGKVSLAEDVSEETAYIFYDPQTSGGMLMSVSPEKADTLVSRLKEQGVEHACVIGRIVAEPQGRILLRKHAAGEPVAVPQSVMEDVTMSNSEESCCCAPGAAQDCCASGPALSANGGASTEAKFMSFIKSVNSEGAISARTKELIAIALSVLSKCEPCVKIHIDKARAMGISDEEITEAVWMAISFGGAPTMMFYESVMEKS